MPQNVKLVSRFVLVVLVYGLPIPPIWEHKGEYLLLCTCPIPCPCHYRGEHLDSCQEAAILLITKGNFSSTNLSGTNIVWLESKGKLLGYIDSTATVQQRTALKMMLEAGNIGPGGRFESIKVASIKVTKRVNYFNVIVGSYIRSSIIEIRGADGINPIQIENITGEPRGKVSVFQGMAINLVLHDNDITFEGKNVNVYFGTYKRTSKDI